MTICDQKIFPQMQDLGASYKRARTGHDLRTWSEIGLEQDVSQDVSHHCLHCLAQRNAANIILLQIVLRGVSLPPQ